MKVLVLLLMSGIALVAFTGCEDNEEKNLYKAQDCINNATQSTVAACSSLISGNNSEDAWTLRCSIAFISEGIDEATIVDALENIDENSGGGDPTVTAISALAMTNTTVSTEAVQTCGRSGSDSLIALANFSNLATATGNIAGILNITDPQAQQAALESFISTYSNASDATAIGEVVLTSQESLCNSQSGLFKDTEACDDIRTAIGDGSKTADQIGDALLDALKN